MELNKTASCTSCILIGQSNGNRCQKLIKVNVNTHSDTIVPILLMFVQSTLGDYISGGLIGVSKFNCFDNKSSRTHLSKRGGGAGVSKSFEVGGHL